MSILDKKVYINNLRFSRFSRRREERFLNRFSDFKVVRSKIFQKICMRASKVLSDSLNPQERIFVVKGATIYDYALYVILEPYRRKYGIEIILGDDISDSKNLNTDSIALSLTLDDEVENILKLILKGVKIELLSSKIEYEGINLVYPLINIPRSWICSWLDVGEDKCEFSVIHDPSKDLLKFLEGIIPDIRENIYKSAYFASCKHKNI